MSEFVVKLCNLYYESNYKNIILIQFVRNACTMALSGVHYAFDIKYTRHNVIKQSRNHIDLFRNNSSNMNGKQGSVLPPTIPSCNY